MKTKALIFIIFTLFIMPFALADSGVPPNSQDAKLITITGDVPTCTYTCQSLGYTSGTWLICGEMTNCGDSNGVNYKMSISDIEVPSSTKPGEKVKVSFTAKNLGERGSYLVEVGIIPKDTANDWSLSYAGGGFSIWEWLSGQYETECCEGQENIFAKTVKDWSTNEVDGFTIEIPKAPYDGIKDKCYDNVYWDGEEDYVLYIQITKGCYKDRKSCTTNADCGYTIEDLEDVCDGGYCLQGINYETKIIEVSEEATIPGLECKTPFNNPLILNLPWNTLSCSDGLTKSEFKDSTDEEIIQSLCEVDGNCNPRKDYDVDCVKPERVGIKQSWWDSLIDPYPGVCLATPKDGFDWNKEVFAGIVMWQFLIGVVVLLFFIMMMSGRRG